MGFIGGAVHYPVCAVGTCRYVPVPGSSLVILTQFDYFKAGSAPPLAVWTSQSGLLSLRCWK